MKKSIFTILFSLFAIAVSAQNAKSILDKAYAAYKQSSGIQFNFKLTTIDSSGNTTYQPENGVAYVKKNKFKLEMTSAHTWFDGKTQWVWLKELGEVNVSNPSPTEIATISPLALLGMYKSGFLLKKPSTKTVNGKLAYEIEMTPTSKSHDFKKIVVAIDTHTHSVIQLKTTMQNNMHSVIDITQYSDKKNFPDTDFIFDKNTHPEVEMIDLR